MRQHRTWISTPGPGLEKRQCALQVCFSPAGPPVRIAIIFQGTGKQISPDETQAHHKDVDVYWQANAWADTAFCVDWVKKTLKPAVEKDGAGNEEFVLFCDSLNGQSYELFCSEVRKRNVIVWYGLAGATDIW
eukprot:gene13462-14853_t